MRRRLLAIPYSAAPVGIRLDWSPKFRTLVFYWWMGINSIHSYHLRNILHLLNRKGMVSDR